MVTPPCPQCDSVITVTTGRANGKARRSERYMRLQALPRETAAARIHPVVRSRGSLSRPNYSLSDSTLWSHRGTRTHGFRSPVFRGTPSPAPSTMPVRERQPLRCRPSPAQVRSEPTFRHNRHASDIGPLDAAWLPWRPHLHIIRPFSTYGRRIPVPQEYRRHEAAWPSTGAAHSRNTLSNGSAYLSVEQTGRNAEFPTRSLGSRFRRVTAVLCSVM